MADSSHATVYLKDYQPPAFTVDRVELRIEFAEDATLVHAQLALRRQRAKQPLVLDGQALELCSLCLDGQPLDPSHYRVDHRQLTVFDVPDSFSLQVVTRLYPQHNTALEGLYRSNGVFCTQCEAEGFRRITYFLDRPDVMAVYTTTLVAERQRYPVLLANGDPVEAGELADGRHWATWFDPHPKPSYLFAAVAGDLACLEDHYTTASNRSVVLRIYAKAEHLDQCHHAMASLQKAMAWDEATFGLEYDLEVYHIVAVEDFNMGAMENKGLNVFNTQYVLAKPDTATDDDYAAVETVIAHEYFHNWTGNRVTCRDWFQLSLKEGLTVFRDQEFSADQGLSGVKRIDDVRLLRTVQFAQDKGPLAHPVRPSAYIEINNFYTVTVYNKGAEVVRMVQTLLGREGFRRGMARYFARFDGCAVTCDDFVAAMEEANGVDLTQFRRWYDQAGTPLVTVSDHYDPETRTYDLTVRQFCPPTPGEPAKQPRGLPMAKGLLDGQGRALPVNLAAGQAEGEGGDPLSQVLVVDRAEQTFRLVDVPERPLPSLLRGFSAPVVLEYPYSDEQLAFLWAFDPDDFNRWDAGQQLAVRTILKLIDAQSQQLPLTLPATLDAAVARLLDDTTSDPALRAQALLLPSEGYLAEQMAVIDVEGIHAARQFLRRTLATHHRDRWLASYHRHRDHRPYALDAAAVGSRALKNRALDYLLQNSADAEAEELALAQFQRADNMTDQLAALTALVHGGHAGGEAVLEAFYQSWHHEPLVVDKWFALQATAPRPDALENLEALLQHPAFSLTNPNKVRATIGAFCRGNPRHFHRADGRGYAFLASKIAALDPLNPQVAARLAGVFTRWRRFDAHRQGLIRAALEELVNTPSLSPDVYEVVAKSLS